MKFSGKYSNKIISGGIGHNLPQEAPQAFAHAVVEVSDLLIICYRASAGTWLLFLLGQ